ncbi:hypothetical protein GF373_14010 [bacterium]|nr:hypothetical protein [bacterium]
MDVLEGQTTRVDKNTMTCSLCHCKEHKSNLLTCEVCKRSVCDSCRLGRYCVHCLGLFPPK